MQKIAGALGKTTDMEKYSLYKEQIRNCMAKIINMVALQELSKSVLPGPGK